MSPFHDLNQLCTSVYLTLVYVKSKSRPQIEPSLDFSQRAVITLLSSLKMPLKRCQKPGRSLHSPTNIPRRSSAGLYGCCETWALLLWVMMTSPFIPLQRGIANALRQTTQSHNDFSHLYIIAFYAGYESCSTRIQRHQDNARRLN